MIQYFYMKRGFTLIELLVAVAIIGLLSSVVLASLNSARVGARDAQRRQDVSNASKALELYHVDHNTYEVAGSGYQLGGEEGRGMFSWTGGDGYTADSVAQALVNGGYLQGIINDPLVPLDVYSHNGRFGYTIYPGRSETMRTSACVFAMLEKPTAKDLATIEAGTSPALYTYVTETLGMNHGSCVN